MDSETFESRRHLDQPFSVVILAGGHSERLGRDKAHLCLNGRSLVQRTVDNLSALSNDIICVARSEQNIEVLGARVIFDIPGATGVLAALRAGLLRSLHPWTLVVACDMPFVDLSLIRYMQTLTEGYDIVVPSLQVGMEPLHALYHKQVLESLSQAIVEGRKRVISFYEDVRVRIVHEAEVRRYDPQLRSFYNINTPADLEQARVWSEDLG